MFDLQHDLFDPDRAENRLLRLALDKVCRLTHESTNWRISRELDAYLSPVPPSQDVAHDFREWRSDRLMAYYERVKPWCELILREQLPVTVSGEWQGISLLFPMEKLFERYVASCLRRKLARTATIVLQGGTKHLCSHNQNSWFELRPDMLISHGKQKWVLDTKWKRLNQSLNTTKHKYLISQADMYQMFAYGQRYLDGAGKMMLICPKTSEFSQTLPMFQFSNDLELWAVAFDLESGAVIGDGMPEDLKAVVGLVPWSDK